MDVIIHAAAIKQVDTAEYNPEEYIKTNVNGAPIIGNKVFIGSGGKIIGSITIADDVVIGANAVVTKDFLEANTTWAGNPAKKVSNNGSYHYLNR